MPFGAWSDLTLEIDGQAETHEALLSFAGFLVRQALADQNPERVKTAADVESLLYGVKAHVQITSGGSMTVGDAQPDDTLTENRVVPGVAIGNLLLAANEPDQVGVEQLHERLQPSNAMARSHEDLKNAGLDRPMQVISALLPSLTINLQPPFRDVQRLVYPSKLEAFKAQQALNELAGIPVERCELVLGEQPLADDQPAYPLAYDMLSLMLLSLRQRALEAGEPDLAARQDEWTQLRLVVGAEVTSTSEFLLNPETYLPALGQPVRGIRISGSLSVLVPENQDLEAAEQLWDALADEAARKAWQDALAGTTDMSQALMVSLNVCVRLDVMALDGEQRPQVLESHFDRDVISEQIPADSPYPEELEAPVARLELQAPEPAEPAVKATDTPA
ncbi:MAG TPA: hypothetical protein VN156_15655, partial [Pseudomonas sp.]|nr:hypothetical protein [Pseudomonas sp.]